MNKMDSLSFIAKLKSNGSEKDIYDLDKLFEEYKTVFSNLCSKDKGSFALNVLCVLCRNLDKVPQWRDRIDNKSLLILSIECVRSTRSLVKEDRVKTLACIYHLHRHAVRQMSPVPPELVLKFSYMPFEYDEESLLTAYHKTYWSIIAERLTYIEKLKSNRMSIAKLLPKLIEDVDKVIKMYDSILFCQNFLVFLVKKLHFVFNDSNRELNKLFGKIFDVLAKKSLDSFKNIKDRDAIDIYVKFNECFIVIVENGLKIKFKEIILDEIVRNCIVMLGHHSDIFHCLQTFYLNTFCCIFNGKAACNNVYVETIIKNLAVACETAENLGYKTVMYATYPFLNQCLRIYIENKLAEASLIQEFCETTQINCLKLMLLFMKKLRNTTQLLKCENCPVKSGLHDSLRLSFLVKNFICESVGKVDMKNILPYYYIVVQQQYSILYELRSLGCPNFSKCFRKLQTDIHNTAISLNKAQYFEFSIKIFDVYLINEIKNFKNASELKNLTRGLYNKSICELDCKLHEQALNDAFLSMVLANLESSTEKYMSLVMDIKAKMLKNRSDSEADDKSECEENLDTFQLLTVLDVTRTLLESNPYGDLKPFLRNIKFSALLKHEFSMYVKLWPSILPIAGVWISLRDMANGKHEVWLPVREEREEILNILYEVILETATVVRTIHSDYYKDIVTELVMNFNHKMIRNSEAAVIYSSLLLLQSEYILTSASQKYGWKIMEHTVDPDEGEAIRTFPQEYHATRSAVKAVQVLTTAIKDIQKDSPLVRHALQIAEVSVHQFLHMQDLVHGLQLASICCEMALLVADKESYIRNAGTVVSHADRKDKYINNIIGTGKKFLMELMTNTNGRSMDTCLLYICELAIFYNKQELFGAAARLVCFVQTRILEALETQPDVNLDLSTGRLMEAQYELSGNNCSEQTILSSVNNIHRHYIAIANLGTTYTTRRTRSLLIKHRASVSGLRAVNAAFSLRLYRRARATAAATLPLASAATQALVHGYITNVANVLDAQVKIDLNLHILGLGHTNETQPYSLEAQTVVKHEPFTPKTANLETMLDCVTFKKTESSPSRPYVPAFKTPTFFNHEQLCTCYACEVLYCDVIACFTSGLEASMYYRRGEFDTARDYYDGALNIFHLAEGRFKNKITVYKSSGYNQSVLDIVACVHRKLFREILVQFLIDASYFELAQRLYDKSDDFVIRIHEIISEMRVIDPYLENEVFNLMVASAHARRAVKTPECGLESDFECMKLSPVTVDDLQKTPETKCLPVENLPTKLIVGEELPKVRRKVIKLNLDQNNEEVENNQAVVNKPKRGKNEFKIPIPVTNKPALENVTPRPTRSKPALTVTQPSLDVENTPQVNEFFTPQSTPSNELFFTPMTSVKTYAKKSAIVKNLTSEFSPLISVKKSSLDTKNVLDETKIRRVDTKKLTDNAGKTEKEKKIVQSKTEVTKNVDTLGKSSRDKRTLKRATSPGKLVKEERLTTRSRRRLPIDK